jgi:hypothetical protein
MMSVAISRRSFAPLSSAICRSSGISVLSSFIRITMVVLDYYYGYGNLFKVLIGCDIKHACQLHAMERVLWWLIAGTKGGVNRARMINALRDRPYNANQLSEVLALDYKTIRYHLKVLSDVFSISGDGVELRAIRRDMGENWE